MRQSIIKMREHIVKRNIVKSVKILSKVSTYSQNALKYCKMHQIIVKMHQHIAKSIEILSKALKYCKIL